MSEARPVSRNLLVESLLYAQPPGPLLAAGAPGMTEAEGDPDLVECLEGSNQVALRLACIGDEMDLRLRGPRLAQLPGMAMHSLAVSYSQAGVGGVLRSLTHGLASLREHLRSWRPMAPSTRVRTSRLQARLGPCWPGCLSSLDTSWYATLQPRLCSPGGVCGPGVGGRLPTI
uniref:Uncharacterized protein n=1 Tax=Sciurus vulgaris TaxID=55149 RepID=A0A8D2ARA3_SCIVU